MIEIYQKFFSLNNEFDGLRMIDHNKRFSIPIYKDINTDKYTNQTFTTNYKYFLDNKRLYKALIIYE